ncbi:hypothetical protein PLANPX_2336 [Lacipirellula parvula]|uniref:Uncharacterized protein n=1 Tax=Lacipirellula parvula TaxID=2650471 RepID=A0A5K7X7K7_9BACT|nr:hypothetical protein PLANPX_2336 [Lacipirellula parvula]
MPAIRPPAEPVAFIEHCKAEPATLARFGKVCYLVGVGAIDPPTLFSRDDTYRADR